MPSVRIKRGTRAQIASAAAANGLKQGELYHVTDENRVDVGTGTDTSSALATKSEVDGKEPTISAGTSAQYWRGDKSWRDFFTDVRGTVLTGLSTATNAAVAAADTVLAAMGKLQAQITAHTGSTSNPHGVTKTQVGLGNVDNTSDANKPISTATQTALDATVKRLDVGASPAQVPAGQHLGRLAYMDELAALRATLTQPQAIGAVWVERVSDTSIKLFMRGSDGVARSTTLTLS